MAKQASVNNSPATGAVAIFDLMTFLVASLAMEVLEASDGTTYEADVPTNGNPITGGGAGAGGMANANAWFRIREAGGAGGREWTFQRDNTNNTDWRVKFSALDGFTGGTPGATQTPSATDEHVIFGSGTDASPTHATMFTADGSYRWHLVGYDVAETGVYPWYAYATANGTGVPRTLIMVDSLESGTFPALVGTRATPTSGEPDPAIYVCAFDASTFNPFLLTASSAEWQDRTSPPGRAWYAMNGSNGETEAVVNMQAGAMGFSSSFGDRGAPANAASSDGFGVNPLSGEDQIFDMPYGRPAGLASNVHYKGMSGHIKISGVDRAYPDTTTQSGETWTYTVTDGFLLPFADGVAPLV